MQDVGMACVAVCLCVLSSGVSGCCVGPAAGRGGPGSVQAPGGASHFVSISRYAGVWYPDAVVEWRSPRQEAMWPEGTEYFWQGRSLGRGEEGRAGVYRHLESLPPRSVIQVFCHREPGGNLFRGTVMPVDDLFGGALLQKDSVVVIQERRRNEMPAAGGAPPLAEKLSEEFPLEAQFRLDYGPGYTTHLALAESRRRLITCYEDDDLHLRLALLHADTGEVLRELDLGKMWLNFGGLRVSPDERLAAVMLYQDRDEQQIVLIDLDAAAIVARADVAYRLRDVAFSLDSRMLRIGRGDTAVVLSSTGEKLDVELPDARVVTTEPAPRLRVVRATSEEFVRPQDEQTDAPGLYWVAAESGEPWHITMDVRDYQVTPDGKYLAARDWDGPVALWRVADHELMCSYRLPRRQSELIYDSQKRRFLVLAGGGFEEDDYTGDGDPNLRLHEIRLPLRKQAPGE